MKKYCKHCGRVLTGHQKNRSYCNWDHYQRHKYKHVYKIRELKSLTRNLESDRDWWRNRCKIKNTRKWAFLKLIGLEWLVE